MRFRTQSFPIESDDYSYDPPCDEWAQRYVRRFDPAARYFYFEVSDQKMPDALEVVHVSAATVMIDGRPWAISGWWTSALSLLLEYGRPYWVHIVPSQNRDHMLPLGTWESPYMYPDEAWLIYTSESSFCLRKSRLSELFNVSFDWEAIYQITISDKRHDEAHEIVTNRSRDRVSLVRWGHEQIELEDIADLLLRPGQSYWLSLWVYEPWRSKA